MASCQLSEKLEHFQASLKLLVADAAQHAGAVVANSGSDAVTLRRRFYSAECD